MSGVGIQILTALSPVIATVLTALLSWIGMKLAQLINARVKNERVRGILLRLDDAAITAVNDVQTRTVAALKEASADGTLTTDDIIKVKSQALAAAKMHLGEDGLQEMKAVLGLTGSDIDAAISSRVEAKVSNDATMAPKDGP